MFRSTSPRCSDAPWRRATAPSYERPASSPETRHGHRARGGGGTFGRHRRRRDHRGRHPRRRPRRSSVRGLELGADARLFARRCGEAHRGRGWGGLGVEAVGRVGDGPGLRADSPRGTTIFMDSRIRRRASTCRARHHGRGANHKGSYMGSTRPQVDIPEMARRGRKVGFVDKFISARRPLARSTRHWRISPTLGESADRVPPRHRDRHDRILALSGRAKRSHPQRFRGPEALRHAMARQR